MSKTTEHILNPRPLDTDWRTLPDPAAEWRQRFDRLITTRRMGHLGYVGWAGFDNRPAVETVGGEDTQADDDRYRDGWQQPGGAK